MAKIARVEISKEYLEMVLRADFWTKPNQTITTDAPKDLKIAGLYKSEYYPNCFEIYVKSDSFNDVPEGAEIPKIRPFIYTVTTNA